MTDNEILRTISVLLVPFLLGIVAWFLRGVSHNTAHTANLVIETDKHLAVMQKDIERVLHDNRLIWQKLELLSERYIALVTKSKQRPDSTSPANGSQ